MNKRLLGFNWHRHLDDGKFVRTATVSITAAIISIITIMSLVDRPQPSAGRWCDPRTADCYDQLLPLRGSFKP